MSDLGAIFHVKKDGVQYDAHAYTTLDECPEPNLKLTYKGQQAYVKLEAKGEGDVPCYVKTKAGNTYQVKKYAVPTGGYNMSYDIAYTLIVPAGVKVIKVQVSDADTSPTYVGVTSGSAHTLLYDNNGSVWHHRYILKCTQHGTYWVGRHAERMLPQLRWSPEINKQTPTVTDY